ncbi:MAG: T9SS type A sorting domain-containing protein [Fidelibacterota bacterium]
MNNIAIRTLILNFILLLPLRIHLQNLVVGFTDPYEVINVLDTTVVYDSVIVINQGKLIIESSNFTINQALIIINAGTLSVAKSNFAVSGNSVFAENSSTTLKDNLWFSGNIIDFGNASLIIDSAEIEIPMTFAGEYNFIGTDAAEFRISNSTFDLGSGKLGGSFSGQSNFTQLNTSYQSQVGIAMTIGIGGQTTLTVDNCTGGMEFVITDSADVTISNSIGFVLWHAFIENSIVDITFPPANSAIPNASDVTSYSFSDTLAGVSGIHYTINVQNTAGVFWAVLLKTGSNTTINNSNVIGCGFTFAGTIIDTISGFVNDSSYIEFTAPFADRYFHLNSTIIKAWNFYPLEGSELIIRNSIFGEALTFNESTLVIENSICDGTGGYFGGSNNSKILVNESLIKRIGNGPAIIVNKDNCEIFINESVVTGDVVLNNSSKLIYSNITFDQEPILNDATFFLEVALDSVLVPDQEDITPITGTLRSVNGPQNQDMITNYILEFSHPDSSNMTFIADLLYSQEIINGVLYNWNTQGITPGEYLLWLTTYVNNDSLIKINGEIILSSVTVDKEYHSLPEEFMVFQNYPNPFNPITSIAYQLPQSAKVKLSVYNLNGQLVATLVNQQKSAGYYSVQWDASNVGSGIYIYQISMISPGGTDEHLFRKKCVLVK